MTRGRTQDAKWTYSDPHPSLPRRNFLFSLGAGLSALALPGHAAHAQDPSRQVDDTAEDDATRLWLGPDYWGNRLQDWRWRRGRIECVCALPNKRLRVAHRMTSELVARPGDELRLTLPLGLLKGPAGAGFGGVLLGMGAGDVNWVAQGNVFGVGGTGGGFACVVGADASIQILDNTQESAREPAVIAHAKPSSAMTAWPADGLVLDVQVRWSRGSIQADIRASVRDHDGNTRTELEHRDIAGDQLQGGVGLIADRGDKPQQPTRFWFGEMDLRGSAHAHHPERAQGPIAGMQYTLGTHGLALTAQLIPTGPSAADPRVAFPNVRLESRPANTDEPWRPQATRPVATPSHTAAFRIPDWDRKTEHEVRLVPLDEAGSPAPSACQYAGRVTAEPGRGEDLRIALFHCPRIMGIGNDDNYESRPKESPFRRFTPSNLLMPNTASQARIKDQHDPDLILFTGDQIYEFVPTRVDFGDDGSPTFEDYLYKWIVFLRSFGDLTRLAPTVTIPDDHDMFLGNIWGWSGQKPRGERGRPGYRHEYGWTFSVDFYNLILDTQTSHLPPPADPEPLESGIRTYYTRLDFGGASFAIVEGRTHKSPPYEDVLADVTEAELLGESQEAFVASWAQSLDARTPRFVVTQTAFANPMTERDGRISKRNYDSNAWPKPARDRAVALFKEAGAFLVGGDIHNAVFMKYGVDGLEDGPYQFICCAYGQFFQRWWEPNQPGGDARPDDPPYTGLFTDGEGNRFRMVACTNAKIPFRDTEGFIVGRFIIDPNLTSSGYGVIQLRPRDRELVIEHWDRDADADRPRQYDGWPVRIPIPEPGYANLGRHPRQGVTTP